MKIIGFNLTKISIERKEKSEKELKITQNINIIDITKEKPLISKEEPLNISFKLDIEYGSNFAKIEFKGNIILLPEKDESKRLLKSWKDKKLSEEFRTPLFNFIMTKCSIKALSLEDEVSLPPHIQLPRLSQNQE
tara:strand:- start:44 stop:448 length:405 start_codon:yes stop_codon:yes gene_type:complete